MFIMKKVYAFLTSLLPPLVSTVIFIIIIELIVRFAGGLPQGFFSFLQDAPKGCMYPRSVTILNQWGPIPYVVKTNQLGLRGDELSPDDFERKRIVTIGDSLTDGFYVDNDATYPHYLQEIIDEERAREYIVLNAARGGGSIDKEIAVLKKVAIPLEPELVLLQFVTNDIKDIAGRTVERLLRKGKTGFHREDMHMKRFLTTWLITRTALGEAYYKWYWHRFVHPNPSIPVLDEGRYHINGGEKTEEQVVLFNRVNKNSEGIVSREPFSEEVYQTITNYCRLLNVFFELCRQHDIQPVFIYVPNYVQIYDESASMKIRDILRETCIDRAVPFVDVTPSVRREGMRRVLHLTPLDFHFNPDGNKVVAQAIYEFLAAQELI